MSSFESSLEQTLQDLRNANLYRIVRPVDSPQGTRIQIGDRWVLNLSSNDYLGLANHPVVKQAAIDAIENYGAGSGASRLICGSLRPHHDLEEALAQFKQTEAALVFSSGYVAAVGTICALLGRGDVVILDKLVHASIVDAARLSGAKLRVFAHNDLGELEDILKWVSAGNRSNGQNKALIVTETVFSMDGDVAPLRELVALKEKSGAWLMVDEAHATGICGPRGAGIAAKAGLSDRIEIQMGTLGKALGAAGGYVGGSRRLVDLLINRARSFLFSTAPVPAATAAAAAALSIVQCPEGEARREAMCKRVMQLRNILHGIDSPRQESAIVPLIVGDEATAIGHANAFMERGIFVPAIRYPSVALGQARLRFTVTADHTDEDLKAVAVVTATVRENKIPMAGCA